MNALRKIILHNKILGTKQITRPSCKNCIHFKENTCKLFVYEVKDFKEYCLDVQVCRQYTGLCGPDAKYFEEK
jgi:hypothetical protein